MLNNIYYLLLLLNHMNDTALEQSEKDMIGSLLEGITQLI